MRSGLGSLRDIARAALLLAAIALVAFIALYALALRWPAQFGFHLVAGFYFFLIENLSSLTTNSDIWLPGLVAFTLSVAIIHYLGRRWLEKKNKSWRFSNSLCLGLSIPTLFVIAFMVPGIFLQTKLLSDTQLTHRSRSSDRHQAMTEVRNMGSAAYYYAIDKKMNHLPDSLYEVTSDDEFYHSYYFSENHSHYHSSRLHEPVIYLGGGLPTDSDPALPLVISNAFEYGKDRIRYMQTFGGEIIEIKDSELDEWIEKSLEAKRQFATAKEGVEKAGEEPDENEEP